MERFELNLRRDLLSSQVADRIEEMIVSRSLASDERLPAERELAESLGVSRSVVREALRTLAARGLVKVKPGCGAYVCRPTAADAAAPIELMLRLQHDDADAVECLFEVRRTIEVDIAAKAALRASSEDVATLRSIYEEMCATNDVARYIELDVAFHLALGRATHNELYSLLLGTITRLLTDVIRVALNTALASEQAMVRHRQVIEAIEARDPALARAAMLTHVDEAQRNYAMAQQAAEPSALGKSGDRVERTW